MQATPALPRPLQVIAAQGELNASRALKEAASVIARSPTALQLRYLQTLNFIGAEKGTSVLFPIPMDLMSGLNIGQVPPPPLPPLYVPLFTLSPPPPCREEECYRHPLSDPCVGRGGQPRTKQRYSCVTRSFVVCEHMVAAERSQRVCYDV